MKFGTLQSIEKQPSSHDTDRFEDIGNDSDREFERDFDDGEDTSDPLNDVLARLASLKAEIDDILSDMGYADQEFDDEEFDHEEFDDEEIGHGDRELDDEEFAFGFDDSDDEMELDADDELDDQFGTQDPFNDEQLDGDETAQNELPNQETEEDSDFQGTIRSVAGADLVYKRKEEDGNYEELWIYNVGKDVKKEMQIRRAILAGTDIVPSQTESEDGTQRSDTYTVGNVQYLRIVGLPN